MFDFNSFCMLLGYSTAIFIAISAFLLLLEYVCYFLFEYNTFREILFESYEVLSKVGIILILLMVCFLPFLSQ